MTIHELAHLPTNLVTLNLNINPTYIIYIIAIWNRKQLLHRHHPDCYCRENMASLEHFWKDLSMRCWLMEIIRSEEKVARITKLLYDLPEG